MSKVSGTLMEYVFAKQQIPQDIRRTMQIQNEKTAALTKIISDNFKNKNQEPIRSFALTKDR